MVKPKEPSVNEQITNVRQYIDNEFRGLFRDVYNIIEISFDHNPDIGKKIKELVGKRIAILNENAIRSIDSLYPVNFGQTLPPVGSRLPEEII